MDPVTDLFRGFFPKFIILMLVFALGLRILTGGAIEGFGWFLVMVGYAFSVFILLVGEKIIT